MRHFGLVTVVAGLLVVALLGAAATSNVSWAQTPMETPVVSNRSVVVLGSGQAWAQPDQAIVTLGVVTDAETASEALSQNSQQMQGLINALLQAGVAQEDIQTQTIQLQPRQRPEAPPDPSGTQYGVSGYTAMNAVQVRVRSLDRLGELLDAAVKAGANQVQGISFVISDPGQLMEQAQQAAWDDARNQAEALASLADGELGEVLQVRQTGFSPMPYGGVAFAADSAAVPIAPGMQNVQANVEVTWALASSSGAPPGGTTTPTTEVSPSATAPPTTVVSPTVTASPTPVATLSATASPTTVASPSVTTSATAVGSPSTTGTSTTSVPSPTGTSGTTTPTGTPSPTAATVQLDQPATGTPAAAGGTLPVTGWQRVTVPELGIAFEMPEGWGKEGTEWTWAAAGPGAPRLGIDWQDISQGWQPEQMLPPGSNIFARKLELLELVPVTRFEIQAPVDNSDPNALPFQTHLIVPIGGRAYDAFALARTEEELAGLDDVLAHVLSSVQFTGRSMGPGAVAVRR